MFTVVDFPPTPATWSELLTAVDLVVLARVDATSKAQADRGAPSPKVRRYQELTILEVLKGDSRSPRIKVRQTGGTVSVDGKDYSTDYPVRLMEVGDVVVLFLHRVPTPGHVYVHWSMKSRSLAAAADVLSRSSAALASLSLASRPRRFPVSILPLVGIQVDHGDQAVDGRDDPEWHRSGHHVACHVRRGDLDAVHAERSPQQGDRRRAQRVAIERGHRALQAGESVSRGERDHEGVGVEVVARFRRRDRHRGRRRVDHELRGRQRGFDVAGAIRGPRRDPCRPLGRDNERRRVRLERAVPRHDETSGRGDV